MDVCLRLGEHLHDFSVFNFMGNVESGSSILRPHGQRVSPVLPRPHRRQTFSFSAHLLPAFPSTHDQ